MSLDDGSSRFSPVSEPSGKHKFKSYRLRGDYEKPWLQDPAMKRTRWNNLIVGLFMLAGLAGAGVICFFMVWPYRAGSVCYSSFAFL